MADRRQYQRMVGKLIHLSHTRPDIAYAVGVVSRFMHQPQIHHVIVVMRILEVPKVYKQQGHSIQENDHLRPCGLHRCRLGKRSR